MYDWLTVLICIVCIIIILIIFYNLCNYTPKKDNTNSFINTMYRASTENAATPRQVNVFIDNMDTIIAEIIENDIAMFETLELTLDNFGLLDNDIFDVFMPQLENIVKEDTTTKVSKVNTIEEKIEAVKEHKTDIQNVHDSTVLSSVKNILNIIKDNNKINYDMPIMNLIRRDFMDMDSDKMHSVDKVLDTIGTGSHIYDLNMTDYQVLYCIYCRIYHPQNTNNRSALIESLFDALYNCHENGVVVCVTGRVTHIVSSLATLDFDERTWQINRSEEYKNEIRDLLGKIIADVDNDTQLFIKYPNVEYNSFETPEEKMQYAYNQVLSCYSDNPQNNLIFDKPQNTVQLRRLILDNLREEAKIVIELR
jgi:hypothetical protein